MKLYFPRFSRQWVEHAAEVARAAEGVRTPTVHDVVAQGDRHGIVMDRIPGRTMFDELLARPDDVVPLGKALAGLHLAIHARSVDGLPDHHPTWPRRFKVLRAFRRPHKTAALGRLAALPPDHLLHHGDLHPANVMIDHYGGGIAFDWDGSKRGAPAADAGRAFLLLSDWALASGPHAAALVEPMRAVLSETYLNAYVAGSDLTRKEIEAWMLPVAAGRLREDIVEERDLVLAQVAAFSP